MSLLECRSLQQMCAVGPLPPRVPGRADPQVPTRPTDREVRYGRISHLYFDLDTEHLDAGFGMFDIEISITTPVAGRCAVEVYCVGDGFQSGTGTCGGEPIRIEFRSPQGLIASVEWVWPDIHVGRAEVIHMATEVPMDAEGFAAIDRLLLPPARAWTAIPAPS